jgi:hypothetical protein
MVPAVMRREGGWHDRYVEAARVRETHAGRGSGGAAFSLAGCTQKPAPEAAALDPGGGGGAAAATARPTIAPTAPPGPAPAGSAYLAVARGAIDPGELTRRAIAAVGGIERFVKPGADVIVKPNICTAYHGPE